MNSQSVGIITPADNKASIFTLKPPLANFDAKAAQQSLVAISNKHASPNFRRGTAERPFTAGEPVDSTIAKLRGKPEFRKF